MDNKKTIIFLSISIFIVIMTTAGVTYAYLSLSEAQSEPNVISTACFDVSSEDSNIINSIGYPMSKGTAFSNKNPYTFTLTKKNNCTTNTKYKVYLNILNDTNLDTSLIRYSFDKENESTLTSPVTLPAEIATTNVRESYLIDEGDLKTSSLSKSLYMWINEGADNTIMGQQFKAQILVYNVPDFDSSTSGE